MARPKKENSLVAIMVYLPMEIRDDLRRMAAQINLDNPSKVTSAAQIAREIIMEHFKNIEKSNS